MTKPSQNCKLFVFSVGIGVALSFAPHRALAQNSDPVQMQDQQGSVADAARKARADKKAPVAKTTKVFTNDDLGDIKGTINVVGGEQAATDAAKPPATPASGDAKNETYFTKKFADARKTLTDDQKELDVLQREFNLKQTQFYSDPNVALREQNSREDINKTQADIDAKKADVDKDQAAISDLEDDLRKSGGDPGWANPPQ